MKLFGRVLGIFGIGVLLSMLGLFVFRYLSSDACLDGGGVFDYAALLCRTDVQTLPVGRLVDPLLAIFLLALGSISWSLGAMLSRRSE
jgi:hypothetical protein